MKKLNYLFILFLFCACVEHKFFFKVTPDGSYKVHYSAHGDKMDLQDHDFSMPSGVKWVIHSTMEKVEAESYDYSAHRLFNRNETFPASFYKGDSIYFGSLLKHSTEIKHSNWFFWEKYKFEMRFVGRKVKSKYPLVRQFMDDIENPPDGWIREALIYLLTETLKRTDLEWNTRPIITAELNNWIEEELQSVGDSTLFEELDYYKNLGLDVIMQPVPPILYNEMDSIFKTLEDELEITLDLIDDSFEFQLILPGILEFNNADSLAGDTLFWSLNLDNYLSEDYILTAESGINYPGRQKWSLAFFIILGFLFIGIRIRRKRTY